MAHMPVTRSIRPALSATALTALATVGILCALTVSPPSATADGMLDCVIRTRERAVQGTPVPKGAATGTSPANAMFAAARAVEAIAKANVNFMSGNRRPIRVRTTTEVWSGPPYGAIINTVAYTEKAWVRDRSVCDVIPEADRGGDLTEGAIHVILNDPRSFLTMKLGNQDFEAYQAPEQTGEFAGYPVYDGMYVLISRSGKVPWVPITVAEALAHQETLFAARLADWQKQKQQPWMSEAKIQESYEAMRKIDARSAETTRTALLQVMSEEKVRRTKMEADSDAAFVRQAAAWRAYRASLSPAQLDAPAALGVPGSDGVVRVDDPRGRRLVKVDPAFAALPPGDVHLIRVFRGDWPHDPVPGRTEWARRTNDTLDFEALAALAGRSTRKRDTAAGAGGR